MCVKAENKHLEGLTLRKAAAQTGKHPVDVMLDLAASEDLKTEFFAPAVNQDMNLMKELIDTPHIAFGVSDGGAHTKFLTAGRFPTEGIVKYRAREAVAVAGADPLAAERAAGVLRAASRTAASCAKARRPTSWSTISTSSTCCRSKSCMICRATNGVACRRRMATSTPSSTAK